MLTKFSVRGTLLSVLTLLVACGGGGGGSSSSSSSSGGTPPPVLTLFVATQPSGATPSVAFTVQPVVHVRSNGAPATTDDSTVVTVSIVSGTGRRRRHADRHHQRHGRRGCYHVHQPRHQRCRARVISCASPSSLNNYRSQQHRLRRSPTPLVRSLSVTTQPSGAPPSAELATQPVIQVRSNGMLDATDNTHGRDRRHRRGHRQRSCAR